MVLTVSASADPWINQSGHGYQANKHHKYEHRDKHVGYGPPPWAPAHGSRNTPGANDDQAVQNAAWYDSPQVEFLLTSEKIGIAEGNCNREVVGAIVGGIIGGAIGNKVPSQGNKTPGTVAGSLIGVVVGKEIGRNMDKADAQCTNQALERSPDGQAINWNNPDTGHRYSVIPYQTYKLEDGRYCRKYRASINAGSNTTKYYADTACRSDEGVWEALPPS